MTKRRMDQRNIDDQPKNGSDHPKPRLPTDERTNDTPTIKQGTDYRNPYDQPMTGPTKQRPPTEGRIIETQTINRETHHRDPDDQPKNAPTKHRRPNEEHITETPKAN